MRRLPNSYLWLLEPSGVRPKISKQKVPVNVPPGGSGGPDFDGVEKRSVVEVNNEEFTDKYEAGLHNSLVVQRLRRSAAAQGVRPDRLLFAPRTGKRAHILRYNLLLLSLFRRFCCCVFFIFEALQRYNSPDTLTVIQALRITHFSRC